MLDKLGKAFEKLRVEVTSLRNSVSTLEKVRQVSRDGKDGQPGADGVSPSVEDVVAQVLDQIPVPETIDKKAIIAQVLDQIPTPRDGRDAQQVNVSDVAAIVLAKIPKPIDGKDGPSLESVVSQVKAATRNGKDGAPGAAGVRGKPGRAGVSVTDVQLNNNELFVFLDGVKKLVGKIKMPAISAPFTPGGGGSGVSAAELRKIRPAYGSMGILQRDVGDADPYQIVALAHPSGTDRLNPPGAPMPAGPGPFGGYYKVDAYVLDGPLKEISVIDATIVLPVDGIYTISEWVAFRHSANGATVGFALGIERAGQILFGLRPISSSQANNNKLTLSSAGGTFSGVAGDKLSVWVATDTAGTITVGNSGLAVNMLEDKTQ